MILTWKINNDTVPCMILAGIINNDTVPLILAGPLNNDTVPCMILAGTLNNDTVPCMILAGTINNRIFCKELEEPNSDLQAAVATLSTGPVGPSDMIQHTNVSLLMQ